MRAIITLALLATALPLPAGEGTWSTPVLGAIFDTESKAVLPVLGIPGSATLGEPVASPVKIDRAWVAPDGSSAIVTGEEGTAMLFWTGSGLRIESLKGALRPVSASWNERKVALYGGGTAVQIWEGSSMVEERTVESAPALTWCKDGRLLSGVCHIDGDYSIEESALIRVQNGNKETVDAGPFSVVTAAHGAIIAAGREVLMLQNGDSIRLPLQSPAVSVEPMRSPGTFMVLLEDGSYWCLSAGELQLLRGGRQ